MEKENIEPNKVESVETKETKKKNKKKTMLAAIMGILLIVLLVLLGIYYGMTLKSKEPTTNKNSKNSEVKNSEEPNNNEERNNNQEPEKDNIINIYGKEEGAGSEKIIDIKNDRLNDDYKKLATYNCESDKCSLLSSSSADLETVIIKDKDYLVYNFKTNKTNVIDFGDKLSKVNEHFEYETSYLSQNKVNNIIYYEFGGSGFDYNYYDMIMDSNFKTIIEPTSGNSISMLEYLDNGDIVYFDKEKMYKYYAKEGKKSLVGEYNKMDNWEGIITHDYVVVVDKDNYLKVLDLNGKEITKLAYITNKMKMHSLISGWYDDYKEPGIYVQVEDPSVTYEMMPDEVKKEYTKKEFEESHLLLGYEYFYIPSKNKVGKDAFYIGGYAKPILYLYPTKDNTKISVTFAKPNLLTTTYPKYQNKWEVIANKNGDLHDSQGKYYYGLYWDESGSSHVDFKEGFYVTKENAIDFLEEKLSILGLNDREKNEFIMYWLPILERNNKNLVYFELTDSRQNYNELKITPKPDSLLRIAIHVKKVNKETPIKEQTLKTFKRTGSSAVEWGGVILRKSFFV